MLTEEQQLNSTTRLDVRPKDLATTTAGVDFTMQQLPVKQPMQAFIWWIGGMLKDVPESTQIRALNAAKSTICNILSEVMITTTTP